MKRIQLTVLITDDCDLRCHYCIAKKHPVTISSALIERLVGLLAHNSAPIDLNLHGGEPLLAWERFTELTERCQEVCKGRGLTLNTCTNGTQLTPPRAQYLAERGFNVRVSIDGNQASHIAHRSPADRAQARESYRATLAGLRNSVHSGASTAVNMVVTPETVPHLLKNAVFLLKQGLSHLLVSPAVGVRWPDQSLLKLDRQLSGLGVVYGRLLLNRPGFDRTRLRRVLLSEIGRASYCIGEPQLESNASVVVVGPTGRLFSDEKDARTEDALEIGHLNTLQALDDLPAQGQTMFQLLYRRKLYPEAILRDIKRSHRILRRRLTEIHDQLGPEAGGDLR